MYYLHAQHPQAGEAGIDKANEYAADLAARLQGAAGANRLLLKVLAYLQDFPQLVGYTLTVRSDTPAVVLRDAPTDDE